MARANPPEWARIGIPSDEDASPRSKPDDEGLALAGFVLPGIIYQLPSRRGWYH